MHKVLVLSMQITNNNDTTILIPCRLGIDFLDIFSLDKNIGGLLDDSQDILLVKNLSTLERFRNKIERILIKQRLIIIELSIN